MSLRHRESLPGPAGQALLAFTDRVGGTSRAPYAGSNLGAHVGDAEADVAANRAELARDLGVRVDQLVFMQQVHGAEVVQVDGPLDGPPPQADSLVTATPGLALVVLVADCVPIVLADTSAGVVGVAHAGRRGMAAGVAVRAVEAMVDLGAQPGSIVARLGASVCPRCYSVPAEMRDDVARVAPVTGSVDRHGNPSLDIAGGVLSQLAPHCAELAAWPGCTAEDPALFSHRRDGVTGRFAGVALLTAPA